MYRTILVPLDGSKRAEQILPHVEVLASTFQAKVILLEVIDPADSVMAPYGLVSVVDADEVEARVEVADRYMSGLVDNLRAKGINAVERTEAGAPIQAILAVAQDEQVDLIAMASHGRVGLARVLHGSIAAEILHQIDRPLLILRANDE